MQMEHINSFHSAHTVTIINGSQDIDCRNSTFLHLVLIFFFIFLTPENDNGKLTFFDRRYLENN